MDLSIVELVDALHRKLAPTGDLRQYVLPPPGRCC